MPREQVLFGDEVARGAQGAETLFQILEGLPRRKARGGVRLTELAGDLEEEAIKRAAMENMERALSKPVQALERELKMGRTKGELSRLPQSERLSALQQDLGIQGAETQLGTLQATAPNAARVATGAQDLQLAQQKYLQDALKSGTAEAIYGDNDEIIGYVTIDPIKGTRKMMKAGGGASLTKEDFRVITGADGKPYRLNVRTNTMEPVATPQGFQGKIPASSKGAAQKPLTEAQGKDVFFAANMLKANEEFDALEKELFDPTKINLENVAPSVVPRILRSGSKKKFDLASENFTQSILRKETGAAIKDEEKKWVSSRFIPEANDPAAVVTEKKINRILAAEIVARTAQGEKLSRQEIDNYISQAKLAGLSNRGQAAPTQPQGAASVEAPTFETEEEAASANLPAGTEIIINGRRAIVEED